MEEKIPYEIDTDVMTAEEVAIKLGIPLRHLWIICSHLLFKKERLSRRYRISRIQFEKLKKIMSDTYF
jgi:hypothetical protein